MTPDPVQTLQAALAGEHAAIYGYGVAGPHLEDRDLSRVRAAYNAHRVRKGVLEAMIRERGAEPVAAETAYGLPFPVTTAVSARRLSGHLEQRLTGIYADVVLAADTPDLRESGARWLAEAAVRESGWTDTIDAFPGLPERPA